MNFQIDGKMLFNVLVFACLVNVIVALQLEGLSTKKPRLTKYTMKPASATAVPSTSSIYRLNATNGATCILMRTDALLTIHYRDKLNEDKEADTYLPDYPALGGYCENEDDSFITIAWKGFSLRMDFDKTPGGERWYMSNMDLTYSSSNSLFEHIDRPGLDVKLSTPYKNTFLFATPVGKSFACDQETIVTMYSPDEKDKSGHLAKLYLRDLRLQTFMYKAANTWGPIFQCSATGTYRDETAPIAVGSTLAIAAICTVVGYGLWRYYKVKKVQYGTMQ